MQKEHQPPQPGKGVNNIRAKVTHQASCNSIQAHLARYALARHRNLFAKSSRPAELKTAHSVCHDFHFSYDRSSNSLTAKINVRSLCPNPCPQFVT